MNKTILNTIYAIMLLATSLPLISQSMSVTSGIGITNYFDIIKEEHLSSDYGLGETYFVKVDFSNKQSSSLFSDVAFKLEKQSGMIDYSTTARFCGFGLPANLIYTEEKIEKYTLSVITYPITLPITKNISLKSGIAANKTFNFSTRSNEAYYIENDEIPFTSQIENRTFTADATFEIQFGSYRFGNGLSILPVYNAFIGLTKEFNNIYNTQSIRQSIGLSFLWGLKKK